MLMALFRWQAKILNKLYKTQRYDHLTSLQLTNPQQIDYSVFFEMTPGINKQDYTRVIQSTNKLCKMSTKSTIMQEEVAFLNEYMKKLYKEQGKDVVQQRNQSKQKDSKNIAQLKSKSISQFTLQHVVVYSSLSKCRIWPKVLKSGIGFVPSLIHFYNTFTKEYNDWLDFKFDPVILTQKYTKIMKKVNLKKKDHPKLIDAVKKNNIEEINNILLKIQEDIKKKNGIQHIPERKQEEQMRADEEKQPRQYEFSSIINNIVHKGLAISHIACQYSSLQTIKYLASLGCDFELLDQEKQTAVFYAVKRADIEIVKYIVEEIKVNINHRQYQDRTLLYLAAFEGELDIVDYLYKKGANPQMYSKLDRTPLSKACYLGNVKVVKYLLSINVDMLKQDNKGRTALHNAVWGAQGGRDGKRRGHIMLQDSPQCAQLLLQAGHPIDFEDYDGFTPFFSAVSSHAIRSMLLLIKRGANIFHKTKNQQNACFIAAKYGHLQSIKILIEEYGLSYTEPDYHGYSSLCASATLDNPQVFFYLSDLYFKKGRTIEIEKIVQCCRQYDTAQNIKYIQKWLQKQPIFQQNPKMQKKSKILFLLNQLENIISVIKQLKAEKKQIKQELNPKFYHQKTDLKNKELYKIFDKVMEQKLQEEEQTQDREFVIMGNKKSVEKKQATNNLHAERKKQLQKIRKILDELLMISSSIVIKGKQYLRNGSKDVNFSMKYQDTLINILSECVHIFNKWKHPNFENLSQNILELAKIINPNQPTIPPKNISMIELQVPTEQFCKLKLHHNESENQLIKILTNKEVITNLVESEQKVKDTLFKLAKYRKTAVIIGIFGRNEGIGKFTHDELLDIISQNFTKKKQQDLQLQGKGQPQIQFTQNHDEQTQIHTPLSAKLTLIQYCLLHGISDIAVYLQQVCNSPQIQLQTKIPEYEIERVELTHEETNIDLEAVDEWVFDVDQLWKRMSQSEKKIYTKFLHTQSKQNVVIEQFKSCNNYETIDTILKLSEMEQKIRQSLLIGIDVQHYNVSKQCFICSIQISNAQTVFILDTLSHLSESDQENRLTPEIIGNFMRNLMNDCTKIKIFHAYENDVKWLHEDFNLQAGNNKIQSKNTNVLDTSRLYNLCNKVRKGQSIGLKTLCEKYLGYEMDKNFQRSDWRIRPLFKQMIQYAAIDAQVLPYVFLRMMTLSRNETKLREGFCVKKNMKSRGIRNRLIKFKKELNNEMDKGEFQELKIILKVQQSQN